MEQKPVFYAKMTKGQKTRARIVEAALELVATRGFEDTSYQEIADHCGLMQTSLFRYFLNRDELLSAMVERVVEISQGRVVEEVEKFQDPLSKLRNYTRAMGKWVFEDPAHAKLLLLMFYNATFNPFFTQYHDMFSARAKQRIESLLAEGIKKGTLKVAGSSKGCARVLHQWLMGAYIDLITQGRSDRKNLSRFYMDWDLVLNSMVSAKNR